MRIHRLTASHAPVFLVNSRLALVSAAPSGSGRVALHPTGAPLLPKLRGQFAEFLNQSSPDRLRMLYVPTCVGLGYGHRASSLEAFLGSMGSVASPEAGRRRVSALMPGGFAYRTAYLLAPGQPAPGSTYPPASPHRSPPAPGPDSSEDSLRAARPWGGRGHGGTGISTCCASTTPCGLALAPD